MSERRVYVHSWHADFARTQMQPEAAYLGRHVPRPSGPLSLFQCGCCAPRLVRIRRKAWMRLLPLLRLYWCLDCGRRVLRTRTRQRIWYGSSYRAPRSDDRQPEGTPHRSAWAPLMLGE